MEEKKNNNILRNELDRICRRLAGQMEDISNIAMKAKSQTEKSHGRRPSTEGYYRNS